jgi:hypothetical protein
MTPQQRREAFLAFVAGMLADFDRYLARGDVDLAHDGVSYRISALWLDDAELAELRGLGTVLRPADDQRHDDQRHDQRRTP